MSVRLDVRLKIDDKITIANIAEIQATVASVKSYKIKRHCTLTDINV